MEKQILQVLGTLGPENQNYGVQYQYRQDVCIK